jgi:hypothetical protein
VDRLRFLSTYLQRRTAPRPPELMLVADSIERATRTWAERLWRRWGRRCRGNNKYFKAFRAERCWGVASRDLARDDVRRLMADPDAPFLDPGTRVLKDSRTTRVAEIRLIVAGREVPVIYKRFNRKKRLDPILNLFRPSRAWRAWSNGQHLSCRSIPTPANLMVIGRSSTRPRRFLPHHFWSHETYLATIKAEPAVTLADYADLYLSSIDARRRRERIHAVTVALAHLIRTLHDRSLSHRDLKSANILVEGDAEADVPALSLIDLVGVSLEHPLRPGRRVQNLARLQVSLCNIPGRTRTDSLRFLRAYLPLGHTSRKEWKALWRKVELACQTKVAQNQKRGRGIS